MRTAITQIVDVVSIDDTDTFESTTPQNLLDNPFGVEEQGHEHNQADEADMDEGYPDKDDTTKTHHAYCH